MYLKKVDTNIIRLDNCRLNNRLKRVIIENIERINRVLFD
jgi:hypothetical protein